MPFANKRGNPYLDCGRGLALDCRGMVCYNNTAICQRTRYATVAQLVEQLIRNQQVAGSSPASSSIKITTPAGVVIFINQEEIKPHATILFPLSTWRKFRANFPLSLYMFCLYRCKYSIFSFNVCIAYTKNVFKTFRSFSGASDHLWDSVRLCCDLSQFFWKASSPNGALK